MGTEKSKNILSTSKNRQGKIPEKREIVIDESGFVTNPDLWLEEKPKENNSRKRPKKPPPIMIKNSPKHTSESGFVIYPTLRLENDPTKRSQRRDNEKLHLPGKKLSKHTNIFARIPIVKQEPIDKTDPTKKRINPFCKIKCPICDKEFIYRLLFEHVSTKHTEHNPKLVLAKINRKLRGEK